MATRTIKMRLEISGDKECRDNLKKVNAELAEQKSVLKLLEEEYKENQNSQEALAKKVEQLNNLYESQIRVLEAVSAGLRNARDEKDRYTKQEALAKEKLKAAQTELERLNKTTDEGRRRQEELNSEIKKYREQLEEASRRNEAASAVVDKWSVKQSRAKAAVNKTSSQIKEYEGYLKEAEKSTDKCAVSIDQYGKKVKKTSAEQEHLNEKMQSSESAVEGFAAALAETGYNRMLDEVKKALTECMNAAAGFETALTKVSTIADTSAVDMGTMGKDILALSNETGQAVAEITEATYQAISAGVETAGAVEFVSQATKLATGGFTDNATSVDILTTVINAYGMELERASEISDYLITTQNLSKVTVGELASSMEKIIPFAAAYNVEMDNLSSAMAIMTSSGIATAESSTYLKTMLNELGDSGSNVSKVLEEQTGISFSQLMQQGYHLGDIMEILAVAVNNDRDAFNGLWSSSEAGIGALSLLSAGTEQYDNVLEQMQLSAGATEKAYARMTDTAEMSRKKMENAFENLKVAVGSELQDQMKGVYDRGADLLEWAAAFVQENEWLVPVLEGVALGIGALSVAVTGFTVVTEIIIPLWTKFTAALSANSVGIVLVSLTALIGILESFIGSLANATNKVEEQTAAWREQAEVLRETTDAYQEQNREAQEAVATTRELADSMYGLLAQEEKSVAEKEAITSMVDQLNEKIPGLGLSYDGLSDAINMTAEEMERMIGLMDRQTRYENAQKNYAIEYRERLKTVKNLAETEAELAEITEKYNRQLELVGTTEWEGSMAMAEYYCQMEKLKETVEELTQAVSGSDEALSTMRYDTNMYAIETAEMTEAQRETIDAMLEAAEAKRDTLPAYYEEIELIAQTAQEYEAYAASVKGNAEAVMQQIQVLQEKYQESYQSAYDNISGQLGLFNQMKVESSQSIEEMIAGMNSQVEYMNEYAENIRLAMEYGVDEGILGRLTDGSEESAAILQEIVNSGSEKIQELNEEFAKVSEGKEEFSTAVAELETYYGEEMDRLIQETANAVEQMARYDDAYHSAVETCNGIMAGVDSRWNSVIDKYRALSKAAWDAYNKEQETHSPSRKFIWSAEMTIEGIGRGVDKGRENVLEKYGKLAAEGLKAYRRGMAEMDGRNEYVGIAERTAGSMLQGYLQAVSEKERVLETKNVSSQTFHIYTPVKSPSELMRAARLEQQYGMAGE